MVKPKLDDSAAAVPPAELMADLDRYRAALERIFQLGRGAHVEIARDALNHTTERTT